MSQRHETNDDPGNTSQVSRIIQQIHEEHPTVEKSREVVIDKNGNKKIRVVKKKRVSTTVERREKGNRRWAAIFLIAALLILIGGGIFFAMRLSSMSGVTYQKEQEQALKQAWGAESVSITPPSTENFRLEIGNITAKFPQNSIIERVEISGITGAISLKSYLSSTLSGDLLEIARIHIFLRDTVERLETPHFQGQALWHFARIRCKDFQVLFADASRAPFQLKTSAYLYIPNDRPGNHAIAIDGGTLALRQWPTLNITQGNILSTYGGLEEITLLGTLDMSASGRSAEGDAQVTIRGSILEGTPLRGEFELISANVPLALLTQGKLNRVVTAWTRHNPAANNPDQEQEKLSMFLPALGRAEPPEFNGRVSLQDIQLSNRNLPAINYLIRHVASNRREKYAPPTIRTGALSLRQQNGYVRIDMRGEDLSDPYVITIQGGVSVDDNGLLSGNLAYGLPVMLTQAEYPDAKSDPLFIEDQRLAWLRTTLQGTAENPSDNSDELEKRAAQERTKRPLPYSLNLPLPTSPSSLPAAGQGTSLPQPTTPSSVPAVPAPDTTQEDIFLRTLQPN